MKIEKLDPKELYLKGYQGIENNPVVEKLNELIDAFNENEKNRSEQMVRFIDRLDKLEQKNYEKEYLTCECKNHPNFPCRCLNEEEKQRQNNIEKFINNIPKEAISIMPADQVEKILKGLNTKVEKESEILPCPFCGSSASLIKLPQYEFIGGIKCDNQKECPIVYLSNPFDSKQEAIDAWNKRIG